MSGSETIDDFGPEMLAAEYVLGTLGEADTQAVAARLETEAELAAEVRFWEARLMPLTMLAAPIQPPAALWPRIEDTTGGAAGAGDAVRQAVPQAANDNRLLLWRTTALAGLAVAASLAAFIALRPPAAPVYAVLSPLSGTAAPVLVAMEGPNGAIFVRPTGAIKVALDRDLELWSLEAGAAKPSSLGVIPAGGRQVPAGIVPGTKLLVSLEPKGGSPTGQPTGPVIYGGTMQRID